MIKIFDLNTMTLEEILDRTEEETVDVTDIVAGIIDTVRQNGDQALLEYRLVLVETIAKVLSKAMSILGITLPERM